MTSTRTKRELLAEITGLRLTLQEQGKELEMLRYKLSIAERNGPVGEQGELFNTMTGAEKFAHFKARAPK